MLNHLVSVLAASSIPSSTTTTPAATAGPQLPSLALSFIVWLPLLAAIVLLFMPEHNNDQRGRIRIVGLVGSGFSFIIVLFIVWLQIGNAANGISNVGAVTENHRWLDVTFVANYHLDADGISLPILQLVTLLFVCAVLYSWKRHENLRLYVGLLLVAQTAACGILCAQDLLLFLFFWGLQIPVVFLLLRTFGGGGNAARAAYQYLSFGLLSLALLTIATVLMAAHTTATTLPGQPYLHTFDLTALASQSFNATAPGIAKIAFVAALLGFAISAAIVPFHRWLIAAVDSGDVGVAVVIAGGLTKLGIYGMIRVALAAFPDLANQFSLGFMVIGGAVAIWGAAIAFTSNDLRRVIAYLSISQMGVALVGLGGESQTALIGCVLLLAGQGLAIAILLYVSGGIEERAKTTDLGKLGGLFWQAPRLAGFWIFAAFSVIGVPLLGSFSALFMTFTGTFPAHRMATAVAALSIVLTTAAMLRVTQRIFWGPAKEAYDRVKDTSTLDLMVLVPIVVGVLLYGVLPRSIIPVISEGATSIATRLAGG